MTTKVLPSADVVLIGGGIMSTTIGAMLSNLDPTLRITILERANSLGTESSAAWNNAGTGHSGYCELNYMPDPTDGAKPAAAARQFQATRQWWSHLVTTGQLPEPNMFLHQTPHLNVVFGERDVAYLRARYETLSTNPLFADMEYTEDPEIIAQWAPLVMTGRGRGTPIAATRYPDGTDVDFGVLTRALGAVVTDGGGTIRTEHEVTGLVRSREGARLWTISGRDRRSRRRFTLTARWVFVGAGGKALRILQQAKISEARGLAVLPVGAAFLRCDNPEVVARHTGKVYGQAPDGAPPMSVPHLDRRVVQSAGALLFGPYATFSTKLLKDGHVTDFFATLRGHNVATVAAAMLRNPGLIRYLIGQVLATRRAKFAQLQGWYPGAAPEDWTLISAGQRAQLITSEPGARGELVTGTKVIVGADHTIAGLLGASPGASTAVPIAVEVLGRLFPDRADEWHRTLHDAIPSLAAGTLTER